MDTLLQFGLVWFVASPSFLGTIPQAYLLLMSLTRSSAEEKLIIWQGINYYTTKLNTHNLTNNSTQVPSTILHLNL